MALLSKKTEEQKAQDAAIKAQRHREAAARQRQEEAEKARQAFLRTAAGQARAAFERGDHVFQYSLDVMNQQAIIIAMVGSTTSSRTADPTAVLNSVCREGWELLNGEVPDRSDMTEAMVSRKFSISLTESLSWRSPKVGSVPGNVHVTPWMRKRQPSR